MKMSIKIICIYFLCASILGACCKEKPNVEEATCINVNAKEVLINFVDTNNHDMLKNGYTDFHVAAINDSMVYTRLVKNGRNVSLGFKPILVFDPRGMNVAKESFKIYWRNKLLTVVESTFKLDSVQLTNSHKLFYYTNTENKVSNRPAKSSIKLIIGADGAYREEEQNRLCVVFNFSSAKIQPTEDVDYHVVINGFMKQSIVPIQKELIVTGNPDYTQNIVLAIEGIIHNYYDIEGILQEPYDIVYEINSQQLFGDYATHILRVTNSGDCYNNKIQACSFDGQQLNLTAIVAHSSFGDEYIKLTIK